MNPDHPGPYIAIDWSGAKPGSYPGSVAVAMTDQDGMTQLISPPDGLYWNRSMVRDWLVNTVISHYPMAVIGIDANLSLPARFIDRHLGPTASALDLWRQVDEQCDANDLYARQFVRYYSDDFWCQGKKPDGFDVGHRVTDRAVKRAGLGHPQGCFALIGAKTVGLAGLSAMRLIHQIYCDVQLAVWPYQPRSINHPTMVEIYPRFFIRLANGGFAKVKSDQLGQMMDYFDAELGGENLRKLDDHDTDALVAAAGMRYLKHMDEFNPWDRSRLPEAAIKKEGWIFGVKTIKNQNK